MKLPNYIYLMLYHLSDGVTFQNCNWCSIFNSRRWQRTILFCYLCPKFKRFCWQFLGLIDKVGTIYRSAKKSWPLLKRNLCHVCHNKHKQIARRYVVLDTLPPKKWDPVHSIALYWTDFQSLKICTEILKFSRKNLRNLVFYGFRLLLTPFESKLAN